MVTNILRHSTKLIVIRPLIRVEIPNYVQPFSRKIFLYLSRKTIIIAKKLKKTKNQIENYGESKVNNNEPMPRRKKDQPSWLSCMFFKKACEFINYFTDKDLGSELDEKKA